MTEPGILVIDKDVGPTSHDVVDAVRRLTGERRVGHAGTLDPLASGVLVVLVGTATRLAEYLTGHDKTYRATLLLGVTTTTDDAQGEILRERPVDVTEERLVAALAKFRGTISQRPPAFAAVKQGGVRAYVRARKGESFELPMREVTIRALDLVAFGTPGVVLDVRCSAGTYVRSLARDLGEELSCGAHLVALRRMASGPFSIAASKRVADLSSETWRTHALPLEAGFGDWPRVDLDEESEARLIHGVPIAAPAEITADLVRAHSRDGRMLAVLRLDRESRRLRPEKVFLAAQ